MTLLKIYYLIDCQSKQILGLFFLQSITFDEFALSVKHRPNKGLNCVGRKKYLKHNNHVYTDYIRKWKKKVLFNNIVMWYLSEYWGGNNWHGTKMWHVMVITIRNEYVWWRDKTSHNHKQVSDDHKRGKWTHSHIWIWPTTR